MKKTTTLTEGTPWKVIFLFSVPIFFGNLFQIFYSLIDTKIVGSTLGELALASVGSVSTLHVLTTGFFNGLTLGFSILTAICFGSGEREKLKKTFAASLLLGMLTAAALTVILILFLRPLLDLLNVPRAEFDMAYSYISVLVGGLFITMLYNTCANTLRAIGDAVTPLVFLVIASVSNIALDYLFISGFHMGVKGAAAATVLAQSISVVLCFIRIYRKFPTLHIRAADFRLEREQVLEMYKSGLSMGLMSCLVSFGTLTLQIAINTLGTSVIVAHTAARKFFEIVCLPNSVLASAMATFSGQNYGAKKYGRIRAGLKASILMGTVWSAVVFVLGYTVADHMIQFIASTSEPEILYWGSAYLQVELSFFAVCMGIVILRNTMQGFGERLVPVLSSLIELVGKVVFAFCFVPQFGYWGIIWSEPVVWFAMIVPLIVKYRKNPMLRQKKVDLSENNS